MIVDVAQIKIKHTQRIGVSFRTLQKFVDVNTKYFKKQCYISLKPKVDK